MTPGASPRPIGPPALGGGAKLRQRASAGAGTADDVIPNLFGLTRDQVRPIAEALAGESVAHFTVRADPVDGRLLGYNAQQAVPAFTWTAPSGRRGRATVFAKRMNWAGPAEAAQFAFLQQHGVPLPHLYGVVIGPGHEEILFMERLEAVGFDERDVDEWRRFLSVMARLNAADPAAARVARLPRFDLAALLTEGNTVDTALRQIWRLAAAGDLGDDLAALCGAHLRAPRALRSRCRELASQLGRMPLGVVHTDFGPRNVGWRGDRRELVVFDLHQLSLGPRFFDVACMLGPPEARRFAGSRWVQLARYYLDELGRGGAAAPSLEELAEACRALAQAATFQGLAGQLRRALAGAVDWTADCDEARGVERTRLAAALTYVLR